MRHSATCRRLPWLPGNALLRQRTQLNVRTIAQAVLVIVGMSGVAHANQTEERPQPAKRTRALAITAAVIPGALVHGSGHYTLGDRRTAWRLLKIEGLGLGLMGVGGGLLGLTGSDEHPAALYVPLLASGAALFAGSFLADLLGVSLPSMGAGDSPAPPFWPRAGAVAGTLLGYRFVRHPNLGDMHLAHAATWVRAGPVRIGATGESGASDHYRAIEAEAAYRLPWRPLAAATLDLGVDVAHRRLPRDQVTSTPLALWVEATWTLGQYVPRLPGAYARGRLGFGVESVDYGSVPGLSDEAVAFVVAVAGLGLDLGRVDIELSYDQRQDGLPGGGFFGRLPGMLGSIGASARLRLTREWALTGETRYGTGLSTWIALERSF